MSIYKFDYITIDFETANEYRDSACQLGIVGVKGDKIIEKKSWLINPEDYFSPFNEFIHGINEDKVKDAPTFKELWSDIKHYFKYPIFAHNASFDMSVLYHTLKKYDLEVLNYLFFLHFSNVSARLAGAIFIFIAKPMQRKKYQIWKS